MTTPTTGTSPLIERLSEAIYDRLHENGWRRWASEDLLAALGPDVLVIEREQARETIIQAFMHTAVSPTGNGMDRKGAERRADELIAALAGESDAVTVSADEWADEPVTLTAAEHLGATVTIRLEPDDYKAVRQAAKASGMRLTAFVRDAALHASAPASDGVTVSREAVAKAYWNHGDGDLPTWDELDEIAPETKAACYAVADSIIAALHASAPVTTAREGE
jgi:hypothetical protein